MSDIHFLYLLKTVKAQAPELDVTQAWFTTRDDKAALQSKGTAENYSKTKVNLIIHQVIVKELSRKYFVVFTKGRVFFKIPDSQILLDFVC